MFIGNFAVALFIGITLEVIANHQDLIKEKIKRPLKMLRFAFVSLFLPIIAIGSLFLAYYKDTIIRWLWNYYLIHQYSDKSAFPKGYYLNLISVYFNQTLDQVLIYKKEMLVLVVFSLMAYLVLYSLGKFTPKRFICIVTIMTLLNIIFVYGDRYTAISREAYEAIPQSVNAMRSLAGKDQMPWREYTLLPGETMFSVFSAECSTDIVGKDEDLESSALSNELLLPNLNINFNIDSISGYDNFMPSDVSNLLDHIGSEQSMAGDSLANSKQSIEKRISSIVDRKNMLSALNVRFIISHYPITDKDFREAKRWKVGQCNTDLYLYELDRYWPRYFLTDNIISTSTGSGNFVALENIMDTESKPFVILDTSVARDVSLLGIKPASGAFTDIIPIKPDYLYDATEFAVNTGKPYLLYIGNAYLPEYTATIDGQETKILRANGVFMAVSIPAGHHTVSLRYKVPSRIPFKYER